ncbi:hypothetical protein [Chromobacterium alticapitis]|uniref:TonB C-terminal domain-containing protein n=1 Tax=Chromobacterium alticapitis TaxID=2073169 RepID=A0A2S5DBT5_9NEIS|nr:hypothetical protein [Chromobacterium alticapitis]POZ60494.1 hypothetical protein C2I19_18620 [Chromobacterium alticapitis]
MKSRRRPWRAAERVLLALWLSILAHGALLWLPLRPGSLDGGATETLTVRMRDSAAAAARTGATAAPDGAARAAAGSEPAAAGLTSATESAASPSGDRMRLGADIYYPASELDQLAMERSSIVLPEMALSASPQPLTLLVFISESGQVDAVRFEGSPSKALADAIEPTFRAAWYQPAIKDGRPVKSYKRIRIEPQAEEAPQPALSR